MKRFLAIQNIIALQRQLDSEADLARRSIIERLIGDEEAVLLLSPHKLSGKVPFLSPSPNICGESSTPRLRPSHGPHWHEVTRGRDFDHRRCPDCDGAMRLVYIQPRQLHRDDGYDVHHYHCEVCQNDSRFVLERNSRAGLAASIVRKPQTRSRDQSTARRAHPATPPSLRRT